jgi:hypothetical protein
MQQAALAPALPANECFGRHDYSRAVPNGLRLSGERSRAERVRCSRGLGGWITALLSRFHGLRKA